MATSNNPRKFSEKIALHNQKQAEETAAFEEVMKDLSLTRAARVRARGRGREEGGEEGEARGRGCGRRRCPHAASRCGAERPPPRCSRGWTGGPAAAARGHGCRPPPLPAGTAPAPQPPGRTRVTPIAARWDGDSIIATSGTSVSIIATCGDRWLHHCHPRGRLFPFMPTCGSKGATVATRGGSCHPLCARGGGAVTCHLGRLGYSYFCHEAEVVPLG